MLLLFAGLLDWWRDLAGDGWLLSATILTRDSAGEELEQLHYRMPVFVDRNDIDDWITPDETNAAVCIEDFASRVEQAAHTLTLRQCTRRTVASVRFKNKGPDSSLRSPRPE